MTNKDDISDENYQDRLFNCVPARLDKKKGIIDKFRDLLPFFNKRDKCQSRLAGRIHNQLERDAKQMIRQLHILKEHVRKEVEHSSDGHLWGLFEAVINPLLREYAHIEKKLKIFQENMEIKSTAIQSYQDWIEKARLWADLSSTPHDREGIIKAIVSHTMHILNINIARDIKSLEEYLSHELCKLNVEPQYALSIGKRVHAEMAPQLQALSALKHTKPCEFTLEELQQWKRVVDGERSRHYEEALQKIDEAVMKHAPKQDLDEQHEPLKEIFQLVEYIENQLPVFLKELKKVNFSDMEQSAMMKEHACYLEDQVHRLNRDLRLTPELADRVQALISALSSIHSHFPGKRL